MSIWLVCPKCRAMTRREALSEAQNYALWHGTERVCPDCVHREILQGLLHRSDPALHERVQVVWPLDAAAAFGPLPLPLRFHLDSQLTGSGITIAVIDTGFSPHPDLTQPVNRIRAWIDATEYPAGVWRFQEEQQPVWPGCDRAEDAQRCGLINSVLAAGNGQASHGFFRGAASEAGLVLVRAGDANGRLATTALGRALKWIRDHGAEFGIRIVLAAAPHDGYAAAEEERRAVASEVAALVADGVAVVAPASLHGQRVPFPPAASQALTVGSIDDALTEHHDLAAAIPQHKPELVMASAAVAVPLLPHGSLAKRAGGLFTARLQHDQHALHEIASNRLLNPHYKQIDARDFAAAVAAGVAACMLQLNPALQPAEMTRVLQQTAWPVPDVDNERQGSGVLQPAAAFARVLQGLYPHAAFPHTDTSEEGVVFTLYRPHVRSVELVGSWDDWQQPAIAAEQVEPDIWQTPPLPLDAGQYSYKFLLNETTWITDPANPRRRPDPFSGFESLLSVP